jgi:dTMP kinase
MQLIALVGADGLGKSTQARRLVGRLAEEGHRAACVRPVFVLFDPWRLRGDGAIRSLSPRTIRTRGRRRPGPLRALLGYVYAVATYAVLRTAHRRTDYVVCDRYFYQYFYDLYGPRARGLARAFPRPDLTVWLDGSLDTVLSRVDETSMDVREKEYFKDVLGFYRGIAGELRFVRVDASDDERAVSERIWDALGEVRGRGG